MEFQFTPEEAQVAARAVYGLYSSDGAKCSIEVAAWNDAPYRTTVVAVKDSLTTLVEAQGVLSYHKSLADFAAWIAARRHNAELYVAVHESVIGQAGAIASLKRDGVGLLIVDDDDKVTSSFKARNAALVVTPDPTLKYGHCKKEVSAAIVKFNDVDRKDGLRDLCELVERETEVLAVLAARRGLLKVPEKSIRESKDWSEQINTLASGNSYNTGFIPIVTSDLKDDLHSFRNARNLLDHKVTSKKAEQKRQKQFAERMMQGPRLIAELVSLQRKLR